MKTSARLAGLCGSEGETIAVFGAARLLKHRGGQFELRGGIPYDRRAAREWGSLFEHDAVIACTATKEYLLLQGAGKAPYLELHNNQEFKYGQRKPKSEKGS